MTLLELTEPLFQYICRLNRAGRKGAALDFVQVRTEVHSLFDEMRNKSAADYKLGGQFKAVETPLVFFVDSMVSESALPCAREWDRNRIAYEQKELAGDEKFYDCLEDTMRDPSEAATERLGIFYTCLGLGFTGWYHAQPEFLRKKMLELSQRIRSSLEADSTARVCPEAYIHDGRDLIEPPTGRVWLMLVIFLVCLVTAVACNFYFFWKASNELTRALKIILEQAGQLGI
jgi:type IV/VI secretion system ImpK/VasF family protein